VKPITYPHLSAEVKNKWRYSSNSPYAVMGYKTTGNLPNFSRLAPVFNATKPEVKKTVAQPSL